MMTIDDDNHNDSQLKGRGLMTGIRSAIGGIGNWNLESAIGDKWLGFTTDGGND